MMKVVRTLLAVLSLSLILTLTACQSSGTSSAATQPSLATVTTQAEAALDAAVNVIHLGLDLKLIDSATYWHDIDPVITAAQASSAAMRADAAAGDVSGTQVASDAVLAAVAKLQPFIASIQARAAKAPTTQAS